MHSNQLRPEGYGGLVGCASSDGSRILRRETLVAMLRSALAPSEEAGGFASIRFARQAALAWLAAFPGDLEVTLLHAQAIIAGGCPGQVIPTLEQVCQKDPFSARAYRMLSQACQAEARQEAERSVAGRNTGPGGTARIAFDTASRAAGSAAATGLFVLDGHVPAQMRLDLWGVPLRLAYVALEARDYADAERRIQEALHQNPDLLLAAALHLLVDRATRDPLTVQHLADIYHTRWPECLPVSLILAETFLELGNEPEAVHLLHQCAANDTTGQVPAWLWGAEHPYRSLWPEDPVILFDLPVPAEVSGRLGWNILPPGEARTPAAPEAKPAANVPGDLEAADESNVLPDAGVRPIKAKPEASAGPKAPPEPQDAFPGVLVYADSSGSEDSADAGPLDEDANPVLALSGETQPDLDPAQSLPTAAEKARGTSPTVTNPESRITNNESLITHHASLITQKRVRRQKARHVPTPETLHSVSTEFERLAKKLKQPELGRADGRQPVYVIFTSREGLAAQYGPQTLAILDGEMRKLGSLVRSDRRDRTSRVRRRWDAIVYYPDDAACTGAYGLTPVNPRDPWKLKNALSDLDGALARRGEMIGALLIVGSDTIVPFHRLPNPTADSDGDVPSDGPYATLGANYFIPDWPVGRLPGENGPDAGLLLEQLRQIQRYHAKRRQASEPKVPLVSWILDLAAIFRGIFGKLLPAPKAPSFGYTAAVWRRSSLAVFRAIGAPHTVKASPPDHSGSVNGARLTAASLGYYNLHGLADSPAWYGQRDPADPSGPLEKSDAPDYPVALTPADLRRNGHAPRVIFSEACYGGHVFGKSENDSLALKFLSMGVLALIGSTGVAYGSVSTPLIAADLLGSLFWQHLKSGWTAGEALVQARIDLVREMNRRQGFLDGEDQKTLISFVLYGDPLAGCETFRARSKAIYRLKSHPLVKTVSDHADPVPPQLSSEALRQVKQIVAEYLPGADLADLHLARQSSPSGGEEETGRGGDGAPGGAEKGRQKARPARENGRTVVTVSKQVSAAGHVHHHYVRVTLDEGGKAVKVSTSR